MHSINVMYNTHSEGTALIYQLKNFVPYGFHEFFGEKEKTETMPHESPVCMVH